MTTLNQRYSIERLRQAMNFKYEHRRATLTYLARRFDVPRQLLGRIRDGWPPDYIKANIEAEKLELMQSLLKSRL